MVVLWNVEIRPPTRERQPQNPPKPRALPDEKSPRRRGALVVAGIRKISPFRYRETGWICFDDAPDNFDNGAL
jgi:hypothetical protein